ncbi:MAG: penicillin-binding protein 2 [Sporanaerobacter sp.]|uniref:penicillin-binding transpeptidase domain-containing protein n=1 Tax=Sporanaerobacter sp. TaxID=2010183 RepID=UPI003A0FE3E3
MKFLEKLKDRYNIIMIVISAMLVVLLFRLATLTIVEGDKYREMSDNKRVKEIATTAPRGEIRDRYGRLLAGNKPSFTVQILKDELNITDKKKKNEVILNLVRLLEEDGVDYIDEFPIELNKFKYIDENEYSGDLSDPEDMIIDIIVENNLLKEILDTYYVRDNEGHFQYLTVNKAIHALQNKGLEVPILTDFNGENVLLSFDETKDIDKWKLENNLPPNIEPKDALLRLIDNDKSIVRKIIDHPISRELTYNFLRSRGFINNIEMVPYSLTYEDEYIEQKRNLMRNYSGITMNSSGEDDFVNIVLETNIKELLEVVVEETDEKGNVKKRVVPGEVLIRKIEESGEKCPVTFEIDEENKRVVYKYSDKSRSKELTPINYLIEQGKKTKAINAMITDKSIKGTAQEILLENGINPKISVSNLEYVSINNKKDWYKRFKIPEDYDVDKAFNFLRDNFKISDKLSKYEIRSMLLIYEQLSKQGYMAYKPINIAYGIKDTTVAKIEEGGMDLPGVSVSIEPVRYYPMGTTAAHILGYIGKISQPNEIKKYIDEKKYSPNDLIGKTGVEEKFEDKLKGKDGIKKVEVDVLGNTINVLDEKKAIPGNNLYLTIDSDLQKVADESLKYGLEQIRVGGVYESKWGNYKFGTNKKEGRPYVNATSGAVVAIDVKTGEVLAMSSYPSYDPNLFATGISSADWASLFPENDEDPLAPRPLYNIATQTAIQPGSTFKMITGLAALENGFSPTKTIRDMGYVDIGTKRFGCWIWNSHRGTHGAENLYDALKDSCNYYFYSLTLGKNPRTGEGLGMKVDIEDIVRLAKEFGMNDKTGIEIDIPSEAHGGVPDPERKVANAKATLKRYLNQNFKKYLKSDVSLSDSEIKKDIEEIISWLEYEEPLTRGEVFRRLDKMGIDPEKKLDGESEGLVDKIKYSYLNQAGWSVADTLNISIGQGQNAYTPIQMANYIAILANGGYKHNVSLVDSIKNYDNTKTVYKGERNKERIQLNNYENLEHLKLGMRKVVTEGTARSTFSGFPISVAAKTGTAQKSGRNPATGAFYDDFAWFVAFAPYEDPEIAVAVVLFQGGSGGYAGPIARDVIAEYLGLNKEEVKEKLPFTTELAR